ncbi:flavin reductase family protein [Planococcus salinus]|uniref:Flavin reductase n=1 Tax=Planococcus salinus TaxID=1848460 RepID=A0A3M8P802_9BACL|nr:flavin reductase family protein [Planococcus salinus]RNF39793.1 flavin reductase [Planococcus salinus]
MKTTTTEPTQLFKEIMGSYPTGVTVITTKDENQKPVGLTANSFVSVSIDPLMILWCIDKKAGSWNAFDQAEKFAVNILSGDQKDACMTFASKKEPDRFSRQPWKYSDNDLPILENVYASMECKKVQQVDAGDHYILIGEVIDLSKNEELDPMMYFRRNMGPIPKW